MNEAEFQIKPDLTYSVLVTSGTGKVSVIGGGALVISTGGSSSSSLEGEDVSKVGDGESGKISSRVSGEDLVAVWLSLSFSLRLPSCRKF